MQNPDFAREWQSRFPLKQYNYDPARANQMLDAAGWARGADGVRAKGGVRLSFDYATTAGNKPREQITQLVARPEGDGHRRQAQVHCLSASSSAIRATL